MKVALVYDRVNKFGGAERVLLNLHDLFPQAPLYTAVYDSATAPWASVFQVKPSFLNSLPFIKNHHEWFANLMPYAFESFDFSAYDVVISITSAEAKGILTKPDQLHLCYLLTPTRYLWSHRHHYQGGGLMSLIRQPFMDSLARWDLVAASRPDKFIAISQEVANRTRTYYHRRVDAVIYPPVNTSFFSHHPPTCVHPDPGYFLVVSRLVPYKMVDLAIQACNRTGDRLIVVGSGSQLKYLKSIARPNITFVGSISDQELACLYHHATGLLFLQQEDFGIVAIEAQAAGIPVIAYSQGSGPEIVIDGQTGILIPDQSITTIIQAMQSLKNHTWYDKTIKAHANNFDQTHFKQAFKQFVEASWHQHLKK